MRRALRAIRGIAFAGRIAHRERGWQPVRIV
jgi:hypothetical protein